MKKLLLASLCFLVLFISQGFAQNRTVTGTVTSKDDGLPLPGVTVQVVGTKIGTQTNANGKFTLNVPTSAGSLNFSFIGYNSMTMPIPGNNVVNVVLGSSAKELNEVVVAAGGLTVTKGSQGYATTSIKPEVLTAGKATNVGAALSGKVAGLQVNTVSGGVNPTVRLVLRGNRSLLGNNQALLVVDNAIVPNSILGNINPEDIDDIQVLNGAGGAALYGSDASNGAIIITTKKGKRGQMVVRASQTFNLEHVSFYPQLQTSFGSGSSNDVEEYIPFENQQYGPGFDGSMRQIGRPIVTGAIQTVAYTGNNSRNDFWETGKTRQSDFAISDGDEKSTTYVAGQYVDVVGTTPGDKYNRFGIRANGTRNLANHFAVNFTTNYVQNRYDQTTQTANMYDQLNQTPPQIVITDYKDWKNNPFADPNGYYNEYYANPYYTAANNRQKVRNDYLIGTAELKYNPFSFLDFTFRQSITTSNQSYKQWTDKFQLSAYTKSIGTSSIKRNDIAGSVADGNSYSTRLISEFYTTFKKQIKDFNVSATLGASMRSDRSQGQAVSANGLLQAGLFNVSQRTTANVSGSQSDALTRQQAVYGVVNVGYKGYLNLHLTGRNDWLSVLAPENRSFFYPAVDVSFIPTEAFDFLKDNKVLSSLKLRAGYSKVGQASIGAYALVPTFSQASGYPYTSGPGYGLDNQIVSNSLKPEITKGFEGGVDADFLNGRITASFTYYKTNTVNQTVPVSISTASGFSSFLINTGRVDNQGVETSLSFVPLKTSTGWQLTVGGNYTHSVNKVTSIAAGLPFLALGSTGTGVIYAYEGDSFPVLYGSDYARDGEGRVIVDKLTGLPTTLAAKQRLGNTNPLDRLGANFELKYKNVRLSALAEYRGGFIGYNTSGASYDFSGSGIRSVYYNRERFVVPNSSYWDGSKYVANNNITVNDGGAGFWTADVNRATTTNYIFNGAYWKLREVSLSYDLPKSLLGRQKAVKSATISVQGRNLLLLTPKSNIYTDPEYSYTTDNNVVGVSSLGQTPPTRFYGATLSLTF